MKSTAPHASSCGEKVRRDGVVPKPPVLGDRDPSRPALPRVEHVEITPVDEWRQHRIQPACRAAKAGLEGREIHAVETSKADPQPFAGRSLAVEGLALLEPAGRRAPRGDPAAIGATTDRAARQVARRGADGPMPT